MLQKVQLLMIARPFVYLFLERFSYSNWHNLHVWSYGTKLWTVPGTLLLMLLRYDWFRTLFISDTKEALGSLLRTVFLSDLIMIKPTKHMLTNICPRSSWKAQYYRKKKWGPIFLKDVCLPRKPSGSVWEKVQKEGLALQLCLSQPQVQL